MSENIKKSAIPAAGYVYQTLQGLKVLCDWLDAPTRYSRVKFECDVEEDAPQGLDDIVIERSDGKLDLQQVKFTPDPSKHLLSWEWLLEKSGKTSKSRSMLRKWFDAYKKLESNRVGDISLITNRRPDAEIECCLVNGKISFSKLVEPNRTKVIIELGSVTNCEDFFNQLHVNHSDKGFEFLQYDVDAKLKVHGSVEGISALKYTAINWAIQKNFPIPDGWIELSEVRTILRASPVAPLPEDFIVPEGYEVPDETFHHNFLEKVINSRGDATVLTGPPGRGKSTYLSYLYDSLTDKGIPSVRHHYYLSTTERGRDRINSHAVEESIKGQLNLYHKDIFIKSNGLRSLIEECSEHFKMQDKPFVVIVDGLDHVWRMNAKDTQPLDDLFSQLLPCPDNMVLLVGTQPVDDTLLPTDLLVFAPKASWYTLPAMSENAVYSYLHKMISERALFANLGEQSHDTNQLKDAAMTLSKLTQGHPLNVIYATKELVQNGRKVFSWNVEQLSGDLSKDVEFYYASLWGNLSECLKDTLRLICAFPFFWPETAFSEITENQQTIQPEVKNLQHLLYVSEAGLNVFHESLAVFIKNTERYEERIFQLMPAVASWLEFKAPASLRVNWLWTVQAKLGNYQNLISGLTRDWILERLEEGYTESLFDILLSEALSLALDTAKFSDAYRLAHLKERMVGGIQYQMEPVDQARLTSFTLAITPDKSVVREAYAARHEADLLNLTALAQALYFLGNLFEAETCGRELLHRIRGISKFKNMLGSRSEREELIFITRVLAELNLIATESSTLAEFVNKNHSIIWTTRARVLSDNCDLDLLMSSIELVERPKSKELFSNECFRAAAIAGVCITDRDDFSKLTKTPLISTLEILLTNSYNSINMPMPVRWQQSYDYIVQRNGLSELIHYWFFSTVHLSLSMNLEGQSDFSYLPAPKFKNKEGLDSLLNELEKVAIRISHRWSQLNFVGFHELYEELGSVKLEFFREGHSHRVVKGDFKRALHRLACDIHLSSVMLFELDEPCLSEDALCKAMKCKWFDAPSFHEQYSRDLLVKMTDEAALVFVQRQRVLFESEPLEETSVHLLTPLQLCSIAVKHSLFSDARDLCTQTWELATGYSHRKDPTLSDAVSAIGYLSDYAPNAARQLLSQIAPQIHNVLDYTDGKGTRHVLETTDSLLAKLSPTALVAKYEDHTEVGDWWKADNSLRAYMKQGVKDGWPLEELIRTGLNSEIIQTLKSLSDEGDNASEELMSTLNGHYGWDVGIFQHQESDTKNLIFVDYEVSPTSFEPEQIDLLLENAPSGYEQRERFIQEWYDYWDKQNHRRRLLDVLDPMLLSESKYRLEFSHLFESAFRTKRIQSGKKAAWKYLVRAQISNGGWYWWQGEEKVLKRLDLVARYFPEKCDQFVTETTYAMYEMKRIAPNDAMTYFYLKQGRIDEAIDFTTAMVNSVLEDTRTLQLARPRWATETQLENS